MSLFGSPNIVRLEEKQDVKGLIKVLSYKKDSLVRLRSAQALGQIEDVRAVEPLVARLHDDSTGVSREAAVALGKIRDPRAVEPLIAALKTADNEVREPAAHALGLIGDARAFEPLIATLKNTDRMVRRATVEALGMLKDPRALDLLIAALKEGENNVRWAAAGSLGNFGDEQSVKALTAALKDVDKEVRDAAARSLEEIELSIGKEKEDVLVGQMSQEQLINELISVGRTKGYLPREEGMTREIGEALNHLGGMGLMQAAHERVSSSLGNVKARELESAWDGIGQWRS